MQLIKEKTINTTWKGLLLMKLNVPLQKMVKTKEHIGPLLKMVRRF